MNHYFTNEENLKSNIHLLEIYIRDKRYLLYSDNGVFSKKGLDFGTKVLIDALPFNKITGDVLDVGCGYGPIGLCVKNETSSNVDMIDVNLRALHLSKMNAKKNNLDVNIFESDAYSNVNKKYDYIFTNPPIRAGKKKLYEILRGAYAYLKDNGEMWFVIRKNQGANSAIRDISDLYNVELKSKVKDYFVLCATKKNKDVDNAWFVW